MFSGGGGVEVGRKVEHWLKKWVIVTFSKATCYHLPGLIVVGGRSNLEKTHLFQLISVR